MPEQASDTAGGTTVLYIDDDEALGVLLRRNLGRRGFTVLSAFDGPSGLALLASGRIDVVILDHYLLGETGLDILPQIVQQANHPPVVYVTGSGEKSIAVEALKRGADDCVTKNVSSDFFDQLSVALDRAVQAARHRREAAGEHPQRLG